MFYPFLRGDCLCPIFVVLIYYNWTSYVGLHVIKHCRRLLLIQAKAMSKALMATPKL
jgi:hypothetical protein